MSTPVPDHPEAAQLRRFGVGRPVSTAHGRRWAQELAYLLAYNVPSVYSGVVTGDDTGIGAHGTHLAYRRSPGVRVLYVGVELANGPPGSYTTGYVQGVPTGNVDVFVNGSAFGGGALESGLGDISNPIQAPHFSVRNPPIYEAYLDVSALSTAAVQRLTFSWGTSSSHSGIYRLHVAEVPLLDVDPNGAPTTEPGISASWATPEGRLVDSTPDQGEGFERIYAQLDAARSQVRRHLQVVTPEVAGSAAYTMMRPANATLVGNLAWRGTAGLTAQRKFFMRARRLYAATVGNAYTVWLRYQAPAGGTFRVLANGVATDLTLPTAATYGQFSGAVSIPCNGTDQDVELEFLAANASTTDPLLISTIALVENEV